MKITKSQLKLIIKEAITGGEHEEQPGEEAGPSAADLETSAGGKEQTDVSRVLSYINKIDNRKEFAQLLMSLVQHGQNVPGAKMVLTKLYRQLPAMAKEMAESKLNEGEAQLPPGGNWDQPGMESPSHQAGEVEHIAVQIVLMLKDLEHNDIVDVLNFVAENTGVVEMPEGPDVAIAEASGLLREGLIKESFRRALKNAIKK